MNATLEDYENILPPPWDLALDLAATDAYLTGYLIDAFYSAFGILVVDVAYDTFPDGPSACLHIDGNLVMKHNAWAVHVARRLRSVGVTLHVWVRAASDYYPTEQQRAAVKARTWENSHRLLV